MEIKLTKIKGTRWRGNGFGTSSAEWAVQGQEHIHVKPCNGGWGAYDTTGAASFDDRGKRIARGLTRNECLRELQKRIEAGEVA